MAFSIIYGDICRMNVDCIVNSLGLNSNFMGAICKNVVKKAKSPEVDEIIAMNTHGEIFDIDITDAGFLPSRNIIHIVTPFKFLDDSNLTLLKRAFTLVINEAIKLGYKSLAIPFLGAGANGYTTSDIYKTAATIGENYVDDNCPIDIKIVAYINNEREIKRIKTKDEAYSDLYYAITNDSSVYLNKLDKGEYLDSKDTNGSLYMPNKIKLSIELNKIFNLMSVDEMLIPEGDISCPMDFIYEVLEKRNLKKNFLFSRFMGKDECSKARRGKKKLKKTEIYKVSIILGLNRTQFLQLMGFANYSFNSNNPEDIWFYNYYMKNDLESDMGSFQEKYDKDYEILKEIYE